MHLQQAEDRIEAARVKMEARLGGGNFLAIVPGTGWKQGLDGLFQQKDQIPYGELGVPMVSGTVEGHDKSLKVGTIDDRDVLVFGRVHSNEEPRHPDINHAMRVAIGSARDRLDGLVVTNGVGTLHGPVGLERGRLHSLIQTALLDALGWAFRGRRKEELDESDLAVIEDVVTLSLGSHTPLLAGEFIDAFSPAPENKHGLHRDNDRYFAVAREAVEEVQGRCPRATYCFIPGPQFEGPMVKKIFRGLGGDVVGMSGQEVLLATLWDIPSANLVFVTNRAFEAHSHENNTNAGERNAGKMKRVLQILAHTWPRR